MLAIITTQKWRDSPHTYSHLSWSFSNNMFMLQIYIKGNDVCSGEEKEITIKSRWSTSEAIIFNPQPMR